MTLLTHGTADLRFTTPRDGPVRFTVNGLPHEVVGTVAELTQWLTDRRAKHRHRCWVEVDGAGVYHVSVGVKQAWLQEFCDRWVVPVACARPARPGPDPAAPGYCRGKVRCADRAEADSRGRSLLLSPGYVPKDGWTLRTYACDYCGGWHVGHARIGEST